jgi:hypothetical protein
MQKSALILKVWAITRVVRLGAEHSMISTTGWEVLDRVTHQRVSTGSATNDFSGIIDFRALPGSSPQSAAGKAAIVVAPPAFSQ